MWVTLRLKRVKLRWPRNKSLYDDLLFHFRGLNKKPVGSNTMERWSLPGNYFSRRAQSLGIILYSIIPRLCCCIRCSSCSTFKSFIITPKPVSKYNVRRSSDSTLLSYPNVKPKATLGERAFRFAAPKLWNAVPRFIRESISIDTFKRKLKTHLFKKAFCTTQIIRLYFQLTRL